MTNTGGKYCPVCKVIKDLSLFHKNKARKLGVCDKCIECTKQYHQDTKHLSLLRELKYRASQKNVPFELSVEDIVIPDVCPVFGIPLQRNKGGKPSKNSPSVDRIIPEKGYVKDNIQVISNKANMMKQDASIEDLIVFAKWILKTYDKGNQ